MREGEGISKQEVSVSGVSAFFYSGILWFVAVGVLAWIGVANGIVSFHHAWTLSDRMDNRVGVKEALKNPVGLIIKRPTDCAAIDRAYMDGNTLAIYIHNTCKKNLRYVEWHWQAKAPDGTVIDSKLNNDLDSLAAGDTAEKTMELTNDSRVAVIETWAKGSEE